MTQGTSRADVGISPTLRDCPKARPASSIGTRLAALNDSVLADALPYVSSFRDRYVVVKIGGAPLRDREARERMAADLIWLTEVGVRVVVVHGGGPQISDMLDRLGIESHFVRGQRFTDPAVLEVVEMVLGGAVNQALVRTVVALGGRAIGLTGIDAGMAHAQPGQGRSDLGLVGYRPTFDTSLLEGLAPELIPIVAPLAVAEGGGGVLNVNADVFAARLASALAADKLVMVTDVPGVRGLDGQLLSTLTALQARALIASGVISGGMIPKIEQALHALQTGVKKAHIIDGRRPHALLIELFSTDGVGTEMIADAPEPRGIEP